MEQEDGPMQVSALRFDWSFNFGYVLTSLTTAAAVGGFIWWASDRIAGFEYRITAAETRASLWIPVIQAGQKANDVQDERIGNMSDALKGIRSDIADNNRQMRGELGDMNKSLGTMRESMAELKAKSARN
jgi:hypothetical protein